MKNVILLILVGVSFVGCQRPEKTSSMVSIDIPTGIFGKSEAVGLSEPLPAGKKACYGINVEGDGIGSRAFGACGINVGVTSGFVLEGGALSVEVPKGENRTLEVIMVLVDEAAGCPTFDESFIGTISNSSLSFIAGSLTGISVMADEVAISIAVSFPGETHTIAADNTSSCGPAGLKAAMLSNGDIEDAAGLALSGNSAPYLESFYATSFSDPLGIGFITAGGVINFASPDSVTVPPYVRSVTRKPDSGKFYGLVEDGIVVEIAVTAGVGTVVELTSVTCPFLAQSDCKVPVWTQSISAGFGASLYTLDHSGNIYSSSATTPVFTGVSVAPTVTQVSYY